MMCSRCGLPIESSDIIVEFSRDDVIHVRCWLIVASEERLQRDRIQRSRQRVDTPRRTLRDVGNPMRNG